MMRAACRICCTSGVSIVQASTDRLPGQAAGTSGASTIQTSLNQRSDQASKSDIFVFEILLSCTFFLVVLI